MTVKTKTVQGRRKLQFSSYQDVMAEARKLAGGETRVLGNWSLGQIFEHLAKTHDMALDGAPFTPPVYVRLVGPFFKNRMISRPMNPGFRLPKNASRLLPDETSTVDGLARLEKSVERLLQTTDRKRNPVFGPMTRDEWEQLHLRHAELHLSFVELTG